MPLDASRERLIRACGAVLAALFTAQIAVAANEPSVDAPFTYTADDVVTDFRNETLEISGSVRVVQGPSSIEAQTAKARSVDAQTQRWTFENAVRIKTAEADLYSNLATAAVINGQIANARIEGTPARFEQVAGTANRQVRGRAGVIEYDLSTGVVKLSNQVWFSNGKDEFRGDVVIYNVRDERMQINPGGSSNRVRGIIRPSKSAKKNNPGAAGSAAVVEPTFNNSPVEERESERVATDGGGA